MIHYIESNRINDEVLKNKNKLVVIIFYADWSIPCQELMSLLTQIEKNYYNEVEFFRVDFDENQESSMRLNVNSTPITLFIKNGEEVDRIEGLVNEEKIVGMIEELK